MDKMDRDGGNKTRILYRCCSNYALSKLIVDNGVEGLSSSSTTIVPLATIQDRQGLY